MRFRSGLHPTVNWICQAPDPENRLWFLGSQTMSGSTRLSHWTYNPFALLRTPLLLLLIYPVGS